MARRKKLTAETLDNDGVANLIKAMFQLLREDYVEATEYIRSHPKETWDSSDMVAAVKLRKECELFVKSPLYHSVTDYDGKKLLNLFLEEAS